MHEELIQANRARAHDPELRPLLQIRRQRGEGPFGYFKQFGGLRRFAGRGLDYAAKKTLIAAVGWNLLCLLRHAAGAEAATALITLLVARAAALQSLWNRLCRLPKALCDAAGECTREWQGRPSAAPGASRRLWRPPLSARC